MSRGLRCLTAPASVASGATDSPSSKDQRPQIMLSVESLSWRLPVRANRGLLLAVIALGAMFHRSAMALVGGAQLAQGDIARHVVMVSGARGTYCTGIVLARDIVLTAAHCMSDGAGLTVSLSAVAAGYKVIAVAVHPQYDAWSYAKSQASVDLALLKTESPLGDARPVPIRGRVPLPGERFVVAGFGTARPRSLAGLGILQSASLIAIGQPSSLQLRLADPASQGGAVSGLGACDGDSGGPVLERSGDRFVLIGVVSWSNGPNMSTGCGGVTGATPLARHREWVVKTARQMGGRMN